MNFYDVASRWRWLIPHGVILGTAFLDVGLKHPIEVPICRYSPSRDSIVQAINVALRLWGLKPSDLDSYRVRFTYGRMVCGRWGSSTGCTHPWSRVSISLQHERVPNLWRRTMCHEFAHVMLLAQGLDGDPEHKLNSVWDRLVEVESLWNDPANSD